MTTDEETQPFIKKDQDQEQLPQEPDDPHHQIYHLSKEVTPKTDSFLPDRVIFSEYELGCKSALSELMSHPVPRRDLESIAIFIRSLEEKIKLMQNRIATYDEILINDMSILRKNAECIQTVQRKFNLLFHNIPQSSAAGRRQESKLKLLDLVVFMCRKFLNLELDYTTVADVARFRGRGNSKTVILSFKAVFQKFQILDAWKRNRLKCETIFKITEHYSNVCSNPAK